MRRIIGPILVLFCLIFVIGIDHAAQAQPSAAGAHHDLFPSESDTKTMEHTPLSTIDKIAPPVQMAMASLQAEQQVSVIVTLKDQADLSQIGGPDRATRLKGIITALQAHAEASQKRLRALLEIRRGQGKVDQIIPFWVMNGLGVTAAPEVIQELAARPEVLKITPDEISLVLASPPLAGSPEQNLALINAPELWNLGWYGQGVVVAAMDTGVDPNHPDLVERWRGGGNSWFDPYGEHPTTPADLNGHGTGVMGLMVGGDAGGTSIGVAPQARWIAVKAFDDQGASTASAIHAGFQWLLDPDNNVDTADAPHVVNNSWTFGTPGCNLEFQFDLQALRAAGIVPIFAGGNFGPGSSTSPSPANYPEAFAVGATDNSNLIYSASSRGPSACGETSTIYPELVAPGVNVNTTDLNGLYSRVTGTSMSAPHVAGSLALFLSAYPNLSADQQEAALINGAVDLGAAGPDNDYGYGRLDALAAYQWLSDGGSTPTPTPTATPIPAGNLALNKPIAVSSIQDTAHDGGMAVDGDLASHWQSAKAVGKNKSDVEWITVDLGTSISISRVVLEWADNFATSYTIQVSDDNSSWNPVFSTSTADGGNDTLDFSPISARYVQMESTSWSNSTWRNWLSEFEIYADGGDPPPTPTPTPVPPTPTNTPVPPTPTPTNTPAPDTTPQAPSNLTVDRITKDTITLTWQDNAGNEDGFYIERSPDGETGWSQVATTGSDVTTYKDTGLPRKTTYWYRVQAYNAGGVSDFSNTVSGRTR